MVWLLSSLGLIGNLLTGAYLNIKEQLKNCDATAENWKGPNSNFTLAINVLMNRLVTYLI